MILKRCASAAPTIKLTVESTSTFGLPDFNGFGAGRLLPNTLILREGGSRYTTEFGIKIPALIPANDLGRRIPTDSGADRYPDLGRLSCGHISLVDGRFGRLPLRAVVA